MMAHHVMIFPVLLPLLAAILLLLTHRRGAGFHRHISLLVVICLMFIAAALVDQANTGQHIVYEVGDWAAPYGIALVLDRLSALMLLLTATLAFFCVLFCWSGVDREGPYFHALFQFQLMGLNGAFLTGDLFNLFVFFEVTLVASYTLLLHGINRERSTAGIHYVVLNLLASVLFLFAVGTFYGITGTLNFADLAATVSQMDVADQPLVHAAGLLLLVVFALKAALIPLFFWLPSAYSVANGASAALFTLMGKVGIYCILRVYTLVFGEPAGALQDIFWPWLWPLGLATILVGTLGVMAATTLRRQAAWLVIVSMGILSATLAMNSVSAITAALFYLVHTTLVTAALFLIANLICYQRGAANDELVITTVAPPRWMALAYFAGAVAISGLPPLSGFPAKLMVLNAAEMSPAARWLWPSVLISSLLLVIAMCRAGIKIFWETSGNHTHAPTRVTLIPSLAAVGLLLLSPALSLFSNGIFTYTEATAHQLKNPQAYIEAVLSPEHLPANLRHNHDNNGGAP